MIFIGIIPARYESKRFPGKVLADVLGKSMIRRVYEQALKSEILSQVIIGTDDERIRDHAESFGAEVIMTSQKHRNGTERCNEVITRVIKENNISDEVVPINIQADEPFIDPKMIDQLASSFDNPETEIATIIKEIHDHDTLFDAGTVKAVVDKNGNALYFSRSPIPYFRNSDKQDWLKVHRFYKHIGIYAYRSGVLDKIVFLKSTPLEEAESLEQLRWLENGIKIVTQITEFESIGIDSPEDLLKLTNLT